MKLTKQQEKEMMKAYNAYWESYLKGDVKSMVPLLAKEYTQVGSAESEVFFNKKDAIKFLRNTIDQVAGKLEMRNRVIMPEQQSGFILIHEQCDLYARDGKKWIFYSKFRASSLMQKKKDNWKFIHQHSSFPDTKAEEGQNVAIDKIAEENLQLREAVKRRTTELEQKNRELEIETALEKVRAVAMSMKHRDDMLVICKTIALQLQSLGVNEIRNVQTAIFYEDKGTYMNYEYYAKHNKTIITETSYTNHKIHIDFAAQMLKGKGEFFTTQIKGKKKLSDWIAYQKTTNVFIDPLIETTKSLNYYWYSLGPVALGTSTYQPLTENETGLFKRFLKVFELSYRRYLDIEKAEAQAKEVQIELALERVRARTMAMQKSDELQEAANLLFQQVKSLGIPALTCGYNIWEKEETTCTAWMSNESGSLLPPFRIPLTESPTFIRFFESRLNGESFYTEEVSEKKLAAHYSYMLTLPGFGEIIEGNLKAGFKLPSFQINHVANFSNGNLIFISYQPVPEAWDIFKRFTRVFEQTYTRYLDLQKAEAQAKEAKIEAALEKVRSRSLAMHNSDELEQVVASLFDRLVEVGLSFDGALIFIFEKEKRNIHLWIATNHLSAPVKINLPYDEEVKNNAILKDLWNAIETGEHIFNISYSGKTKNDYFRYVTKYNESKIPGSVRHIQIESKSWTAYLAAEKNSLIGFDSWSGHNITNEDFQILIRFSKVFEQAYTRFNDLQKAEAQSRESQIQLALERVRARTMAMQRSNELPDAANVLFQQVQALGMPAWSAGYCIWDADKQGITLWMSSEGVMQPSFHMPVTVDPSMVHMKEAHERQEMFHEEAVCGEELASHYRYMRTLPGIGEVLDSIINAGHPLPTFQIFHCAYFSQGFLLFITYEPVPEAHDIFKRFGNVFDQTYTRFLDLQKAEAQAREAQIELALERVRARTMAMQKSDELAEAAQILYHEFSTLRIKTFTCGYLFIKEEKSRQTAWVVLPDGTLLPNFIDFPLTGDHVLHNRYKAWKEKQPLHVCKIEGEANKEHHRFLSSHVPATVADDFFSTVPDPVFFYCANFSDGYLFIVAPEAFLPDEEQTIVRFAKVFEMTYTRFLDLQKAEAQAKEAQIEAALERVRSRAMAMQTSKDLNALISHLFNECTRLDIVLDRCLVMIVDPKTLDTIWVLSNPETPEEPSNHLVKYHEYHPYLAYIDAWKKRVEKWHYILEGTEKKEWDQFIFQQTELSKLPLPAKEGMQAIKSIRLNCSFGNFGSITLSSYAPLTEPQEDILTRFTKVFDLTYTRFNDLKQAEAQAREARIEAALERVRSRTMAMHKSDELLEVVTVLSDQLVQLGFRFDTVSFGENNQHDDFKFWFTAAGQAQPLEIQVPYLDNPAPNRVKEAQKKGLKFFADLIVGEDNRQWTQHLIDHSDLKLFPDKVKNYILGSIGYARSTAILKNINLYIGNYKAIPYTEEENNLFQRFAQVFEQAYTRFLDLKKAEAQAKEAQIEAALERVRSRTMGMQKSEELKEIITVVYEQLVHLNIPAEHAGFVMDYKARDDYNIWIADQFGTPSQVTIPYFDSIYYNRFNEAKATGKVFFATTLSLDEKNLFYQDLFKHIPGFPEESKNIILGQPGFTISTVLLENVALYIENFSGIAYSNEENNTLMRFGKVFQQTYTRFLDLQKAEAQAKEAKIEAALERIRSRSLAMHRSDELKEVITVMFEKLNELQVTLGTVAIWLFDKQTMNSTFWVANNLQQPDKVNLPYDEQLMKEDTNYRDSWQAWLSGKDYINREYNREQKNKYFEYVFANNDLVTIPAPAREFILKGESFIASLIVEKNSALFFDCWSGQVYDEARTNVFRRAAKVFEQAYIRFLDLQKAEAQAREAKIEAALERTRTQSMIMQHSTELDDTLRVFHEQVLLLDIQSAFSFLWLPDEEKDRHIFWAVWAENNSTVFKSKAINYLLDKNEPATAQCLIDWKSNQPVVSYHVPPDGVGNYFTAWQELIDGVEQLKPEYFAGGLYYVEAFMKYGCFGVIVKSELDEDEKKILARFAIEFERTYTRFLDLQKAEAQAKEAQIEAALEKIRSRSLAMHKSEELSDVVTIIFERLNDLNIKPDSININIVKEDQKSFDTWFIAPGYNTAMCMFTPYFDHPVMNDIAEAVQSKKELHSKTYFRDVKDTYFSYLYEYTAFKFMPEERKKFIMAAENWGYSVALARHTAISLHTFSGQQFSDSVHEILKRFVRVLEQAYTRFLDLQKAEAQAREAQIELSLERVRAKTMAMHNSQDVGDTVAAMFDEVVKLGIETIRCGIGIMHEPGEMEVWTAKPDENGKVDLIIGQLDMMMHPLLQGAFNGWRNKQEMYTYELAGEDLIAYFNAINNHPDYPVKYDMASLPSKIFHSEFHFPEGTLFVFSLEKLSAETAKIFKRFAGVFGQTYRRYLDLKKAEAQVRHAQVEAAMEKVRTRSLAMQKPEELIEVAEVLRKEMGALGVEELETSSIYIVNETTNKTECWYAIKDIREGDKKLLSDHMIINLADTWVGKEMLQFYHSDKKQVSILMQGDNRKEWINYCAAHSNSLQGYYGDEIPERIYHLVKFSNGYMGAASPGNISAESWDLLQRATAVFSFAYTRFLDLQKAEAQAREATIETALERVRSRTLAMQKSDELSETAAVLFRQLINLGIAPNRLYIGIIKDDISHIEFWVTDEDGSKVSTQFTGDMNRNVSMKKMYDAWKAQLKSLTIDMEGEELASYFHYLADELGVPFKQGLSQKRRIQSIAFFGKGFIGIASPDVQPEETTILLERFAAVFNLTYTRFNDLKIAEAHAVQAQEDLIKLQTEKSRAEDALTELRATQKQLVQSEKMASLGQLTAGIAHEIQNPLNFVNNFSEVSNELIQELKSEKSKVKSERDEQLEEEILNDLLQNLEKIHHHGKRADSIVKGMLEHSRTSTGNMEPTDINALADEYLRLSYHGIRAKDKSFNTAIHTDFDSTVGKINIIGQDIGRVLLNLYNNAFYAVNEKKKESPSVYEPSVSATTKKTENTIMISVKDNGNGIPQNIVDKIFQPFFTTKPTGSGTGLGLSLVYDIVKAHGGEIRVETKEGEFSEFIIKLPA